MKELTLSQKTKFYIFFVNLVIILFAALVQYTYQLNELDKKFNHTIDNIIKKEFSNNISSTKGVLTSLSSIYKSINQMNHSEFTIISKDLLKNYDYMKSISFATIVNKNDKPELLNEIKEMGLYNFNIKTFQKGKLVIQSENYEKYAPIVFIEPANYKYSAFYGFDVLNDHRIQNAFIDAAKKDEVVIVDNFEVPLNFNIDIFIKATYKGENEVQSHKYRLENTNGFFIIDVDIEKLLVQIRKKFKNYTIKIKSTEDNDEFLKMSTLNSSEYLKKLYYFEKIEELNNYYLYVEKDISFKDFNKSSFALILFLIIIIQILYFRNWYKDKEAKNELTYNATHDDLTGLANRTYFKKEFYRLSKNCHLKTNCSLALLFIDLDRFKEINDSFGHKLGDELLVEIAKRFKNAMRSTDLICRHGGDEFLILIDDCKELSYIESIVKKIMGSMIDPIMLEEQKIHMTFSIGIARYPHDAKTVDELLRNADSAMYKAKEDGRNTYSFYSEEMTSKVKEKLVLENKIRDAIKNDEFLVYFQPQYRADNNKLVGMEALVRWKLANELISPSKFIPIAEDTGLIVELDRLVMKKAIEQYSTWLEKGHKISSLSLNLSMKQLKSDDFTSLLKNTVLDSKCEPSNIELEITEGEIMENPTAAIEKLKELSNFGIKLSVDDFGTGYSSLAYLKKLPLDKLKIDRAFVKDLPKDEDDIAITKSIIALAKSLKLDLIAEGVENKEQVKFLLDNGCNKIQGYFYGKPLPADDFELILKRDS